MAHTRKVLLMKEEKENKSFHHSCIGVTGKIIQMNNITPLRFFLRLQEKEERIPEHAFLIG